MKQEVLATKMGVSQQSISKMERSKRVSDKKIQQFSEIFEMAMDNIKNFDEENAIQNNFALRDNVINPIKEITAHFKEEVAKRDERIKELEALLAGGEVNKATPESSATDGNVRKIKEK